MAQSKEYYAFISYKREDEKWAKWLQDKLEHYKFPTNLNGRTDLPKYIRPTFRDVTDLKPGLLAEEINNALHSSEWLIVVCSPRSAKSPWVCKEAQTFIDLGRADHIIPFVIEGSPFSNDPTTECYPEALQNLTDSQELLAANINEMGRDAAAIKVIARMFNLRFDALWQRYEREKKLQRIRKIGSILVGASILVLASIIFSIIISGKNSQLKKANDEIRRERDRANIEKGNAEKANFSLSIAKDSILKTNHLLERTNLNLIDANRNLKEANIQILQKNWDLKVSNAKITSDRVMDLLEKGKTVEAQKAITQICNDNDIFEYMYIPEIEKSLRAVHRNRNNIGGIYGKLVIDSGLDDFAQFSSDGKAIYTKHKNSLVQYDLLTDEPMRTLFTVPCDYNADVEYHLFDDSSNKFIYSINDTIFIKNIDNNTDIIEPIILPVDHLIDVQVSPNMSYLIYELLWKAKEWEKSNGDELKYCHEFHMVDLKHSPAKDYTIPSWEEFYCFTPDGNGAFIRTKDGYYSWGLSKNDTIGIDLILKEDIKFALINETGKLFLASDSVVTSWEWPILKSDVFFTPPKISSSIMSIQTSPNGKILAVGLYDGSVCIWNIDSFDFFNRGKQMYKLANHNSYIHSIKFSPNSNYMLTTSQGIIRIWDVNIKNMLERDSIGYDYICPNGKNFIGKTSDGYRIIGNVETKSKVGKKLFKIDSETLSWGNPKIVSRNLETIVYVSLSDSSAHVIRPISERYFSIKLPSNYSNMFSLDKEGRYLVIGMYPYSLAIYDVLKSRRIFYTSQISSKSISPIKAIAISPDASEIAINVDNSLHLYRIKKNGISLRKVLFNDYNGNFSQISYSPDGSILAASNFDKTIWIWDTKTGQYARTLIGADSYIHNLNISPDNKYVVASLHGLFGEPNKIIIWNLHTGQIVESLKDVSDCQFCQDVPNKMYYHENGKYFFLDFPSLETIIQSLKRP